MRITQKRPAIDTAIDTSRARLPDGIWELLEALDCRDASREQLIDVFSAVERSKFLPEGFKQYANADVSIPIGFDQTASRPTTCARILLAAALQPGERVLEIGCGSGYLIALFAALQRQLNRSEQRNARRGFLAEIIGVEKRAALASMARKALDESGFQHVFVRCADGFTGLIEEGEFDVVIISAALHKAPEALLYKLALGGRLIMPKVTSRTDTTEQRLLVYRRLGNVKGLSGDFEVEDCGACQFVLAT